MVLTALTPEERALAAQNHYVVERFLWSQKLLPAEWYDVVIFRYLLTVKRWFKQPNLYKYGFSAIAWQAMRSAVSNEREKQDRRIKTISLDDPIPGSDGLTWEDIVTAEHLNYTVYITEAR